MYQYPALALAIQNLVRDIQEVGMAIRNDLNGKKLQIPGHPIIFLVINGKKSLIPNQATYENLFHSWQDMIIDFDVAEIDDGEDIESGSILAKSTQTNSVYLLGKSTRRHIGDPKILEQYGFDRDKIVPCTPERLQQYKEGPAISARN